MQHAKPGASRASFFPASRSDGPRVARRGLWRGMRALIFGDDHEATLRDQIEEAIDEKNETDAADHAGIEMSAAPVIVALYEAAPEAPADEAPKARRAPKTETA